MLVQKEQQRATGVSIEHQAVQQRQIPTVPVSASHQTKVSSIPPSDPAVVAEMRPPCLFFFLVPLLVSVSGDTRALRNRLMTLAKGLPFTRWRSTTRLSRPPGPRPRLKRPSEDRFARAPILTSYTPLIMEQDIKAPALVVKEVERAIEQPVVQHSSSLKPSSPAIPLDHGWSGYEIKTVDLIEDPLETTTPPNIDLVEIEVPEVEVVDMEDVAVALGQAGAVQLNWGESMREAVESGLQKISVDHPAVEEETYVSFPSRVKIEEAQKSSVEKDLGSNSKEEYFHQVSQPEVSNVSWQGNDPSENKIESFQGLRIEDNSGLQVEQPKLPPPFRGWEVTDFLKMISTDTSFIIPRLTV